MKKILVLFLLMSSLCFALKEYNFPARDPYKATILGSSTMLMEGVSEVVPSKSYSIKVPPFTKPHTTLWYQDSFKFSLSKQRGEAPLIFVVAGTGTGYESWKMKAFERIFYDAGYHVILISSPFNSNFLVTASNVKVPGLLFNDSHDIYRVMKAAYERVEKKIEVSDFYLTGYSMGATQAAYVSLIDETEKYFDFKRVLMINPAVNLYDSAKILDNMLDDNIPGGRDQVGGFIENILQEIIKHFDGDVEISEETIYQIFKDDLLTQEEMAALIGLAFRLISIDINYLTDMLNQKGIYVDHEPKKFESMTPVWRKINGASFSEYIERIAYPHYRDIYPGFDFDDLVAKADLHEIESYLRSSEKIAMVTNEDELILTPENLEFLRETFKGRGIIYPLGGHCGNMYFEPNVKNMLKFFEEGVLIDEK